MQALEIIRIKRFNLTINGQKMHRYFLVEKTMLRKGIRLENLCCTFLPARCFSSATPPIIFRFRFAEVVLWKTLDFKKDQTNQNLWPKDSHPGLPITIFKAMVMHPPGILAWQQWLWNRSKMFSDANRKPSHTHPSLVRFVFWESRPS